MGLMKQMAENISVSLGLDGEITPDVVFVAEEVLRVHKINEPQHKAMETAGIAKLMRELRNETCEDLWKRNKLTKRECCVCHKVLGYKKGDGGVTHTYCDKCYNEANLALGQVS